MEFIENPYLIIKHLVKILFIINNYCEIYIKTKKYKYSIIKNNNTFDLENTLDENLRVVPDTNPGYISLINVNERTLLQNVNNINDIVNITFYIENENENRYEIFYNCNKDGCYSNAKKRLHAAQVIQKHVIPRYNNPTRPSVKKRELGEFKKLSSDNNYLNKFK